MVDTNQEPVQSKGAIKKKKGSAQKTSVKNKPEEKTAVGNRPEQKPAIKKLPSLIKKEIAPAKPQGAVKNPASSRMPSLTNAKKFFKGALTELKKVHWPNRRELVTFTGVVLVAVTFVAAMIFLIDSLLSEILNFIVPK